MAAASGGLRAATGALVAPRAAIARSIERGQRDVGSVEVRANMSVRVSRLVGGVPHKSELRRSERVAGGRGAGDAAAPDADEASSPAAQPTGERPAAGAGSAAG